MNLKYYKLARTDDRYDDQEMIEVDPANGEYLRKEDVQPILDVYKKMIEKLIYFKNDVRDNIIYRIKDTDLYKAIQAIPKNSLALFINEYEADSAGHLFITCKLQGDDPFEKDLAKCIEVLWNTEFDMEAYKNIGYNDGLAYVTSEMLKILGMEKESTQAIDSTYDFD